MSEVGPPTAEGDLGQTPFAHLVVYALERKLTGTMLLEETPERTHTLTFSRGSPAKLRPADDFVRLGRLLVEEGLIDETTLEGALSTHGLLGDVLVMAGHVEPDALETVLERQFRMRFVRCFTLEPTTKYRYYEGRDDLADWGAEPNRLDPYELLWAGLERHAERANSMEPTLTALSAEQLLVIHPRAPLERLGLEGLSSDVVELLLLEPTSFPELVALEIAPPELIRRVVFALLLLRCLDLGKGVLPVGVSDRGPATLARVQLKQTMQRFVAAAEDQARDGERARRKDPRQEDSDAPPSSNPEAVQDAIAPSSSSPASAPVSPQTTKSPAGDAAPPQPAPPRPAVPAGAAGASASPVGVSAKAKAPTAKTPAPKAVEARTAAVAAKPAPKAAPAKPVLAPPPGSKVSASKPAKAPPAAKPAPAPGKHSGLPLPREPGVDAEPGSSVRAIPSALLNKPVAELLAAARARIDAKEAEEAIELAEAALARQPGMIDALLLVAYGKSLLPHSDLKMLSLELDDVVRSDETHADARFYRGCLRKRLGDDAGSKRDFEKVLALDPEHVGALREASAQAGAPSEGDKAGGLLGRLFRR